jgi:beta-galactosidase/beta-glucuronidase
LETCDTAGLEACATGAGSKCTRCVAQAWNAAGFFTDGWCNGVYLGRHEGGYIPFEFDLTDALTRNDGRRTGLLVLRVEDPMDNHEQPVGKQWRWYTTVSGIWQTVFIEPRASSHIDSFRITPDLDGATAHFVVRCSDGGGGSIRVRVTAPDGTKLPEAEFPVANEMAQHLVQVSPLLPWDPNAPNLYRVQMTLERGGTVLDEVRTYFGMRKIDFASQDEGDGAVHLRINGNWPSDSTPPASSKT